MKNRKILILAVVGLAFCLATTPAWAGGRINQGSSGLGVTTCTVGDPWVIVTSSELQVGSDFTSCSPFDGTITTMWDLFDVSVPAGDDITLVVKNAAESWGVFDESASFDSGDTTCGDPLGVTFLTCADTADGTVFEDASTSGGIVFYTDPGALQYISETDANGKVTLLYGAVSTTPTPEPGSVWLLLAVVVTTVIAISRRRRIAIRVRSR